MVAGALEADEHSLEVEAEGGLVGVVGDVSGQLGRRGGVNLVNGVVLLEQAVGQGDVLLLEGPLGRFEHFKDDAAHLLEPRRGQQAGVYGLAVLPYHKARYVLGEVAYALKVGVDLQHGHDEAHVYGYGVVEHEEVLYVAIELQLAGVYLLLAYQYVPGLLLVNVFKGFARVFQLVAYERPHVEYLLAYRLEFVIYEFYHCIVVFFVVCSL